MKQTKWEFNYRPAMDSGCTDDEGKIPAILKWDHAVIEAAQNQAQWVFLAQQEQILLEEFGKKKYSTGSTTLIFKVECGEVFPVRIWQAEHTTVASVSTLSFCQKKKKKGNSPAVPKGLIEVCSPGLHSLQ